MLAKEPILLNYANPEEEWLLLSGPSELASAVWRITASPVPPETRLSQRPAVVMPVLRPKGNGARIGFASGVANPALSARQLHPRTTGRQRRLDHAEDIYQH